MIKNEVVDKYKIPQSDIDRGGLRIVSTVDRAKQSDMVKAVQAERPKDTPSVHVGMASVKPGDGAIVALYGGEDYHEAPAERRHPGQDAGRLDVQDLHADRGAAVR